MIPFVQGLDACVLGRMNDNMMDDAEQGEKNMKLTKDMCNLIADLEYAIGSECYNPKAYDYWNDVRGCDYRYPVSIVNEDGEFVKVRTNINSTYFFDQEELEPESLKYMKYKFGTNELFIGLGIINMLNLLEERYGLNFEELERQYKKSNKR